MSNLEQTGIANREVLLEQFNLLTDDALYLLQLNYLNMEKYSHDYLTQRFYSRTSKNGARTVIVKILGYKIGLFPTPDSYGCHKVCYNLNFNKNSKIVERYMLNPKTISLEKLLKNTKEPVLLEQALITHLSIVLYVYEYETKILSPLSKLMNLIQMYSKRFSERDMSSNQLSDTANTVSLHDVPALSSFFVKNLWIHQVNFDMNNVRIYKTETYQITKLTDKIIKAKLSLHKKIAPLKVLGILRYEYL